LEKYANADYPIHDLLRRRWSPLAFSARRVEPATLLTLFEAARWAPSSFNEQPWRFLVATKDEPAEFERMLDCLVPGNQRWAKDAPVLMLSIAARTFTRNNRPNRHAMYDTGAAVMSLIVQATALGLYAHQMGGFSIERAREVYAIPEEHERARAEAGRAQASDGVRLRERVGQHCAVGSGPRERRGRDVGLADADHLSDT
jgi:nitroreductase